MAEKPATLDHYEQTFQASEGISEGMRVKLDAAGTISIADAADATIGVVRDTVATDGYVTVRLRSAPSAVYRADSAVAVGDVVTGNVGGYVETAGAGVATGIAMTAAAAINDLITVIHN